jgi:hypothetical protein
LVSLCTFPDHGIHGALLGQSILGQSNLAAGADKVMPGFLDLEIGTTQDIVILIYYSHELAHMQAISAVLSRIEKKMPTDIYVSFADMGVLTF